MFTGLKIPQIITILFAFTLFLRNVGGIFHFINIGIPIMLIVLLSMFYRITNKELFSNYAYTAFLFLFVIYLYIGTYYSNAPTYGKTKTFGIFLFILMAFLSGKYIILNFNLFLKSNLIFFLFFIIAYFSFYRSFGNVLNMLNPVNRGEMGGEVFSVISTSRYIGFILICLFFLFFQQNFNILFKNFIFGFLFVLGLIMMVLFASKGPILSLLMAPLIYILFHNKLNLKKTIVLAIAVISFGILLLYPDAILNLIPQQYQSFFQKRFFDYESYVSGGRPTLIQTAIEDIENKSLFFGKGTGNYGFLYAKSDIMIYPHNIFIELLYENGIFGLVLFVGLFIYLFIGTSLSHFSNIKSCLIILIYFFLLNAQVSGDIANNYGLFIFLILLYYQVKTEKDILHILRIAGVNQNKDFLHKNNLIA